MKSYRSYLGVAAGVVLLAATLTVTGVVPAVAQGPLRPMMALIVNDSSSPVPVSFAAPPAVTTPLWQGTPFLESHVVLNRSSTGFQQCETAFTAAAGNAVLLQTIATSFNVPPNGHGGVSARLTLADGSRTSIPVPTGRTAGAGTSTAVVNDQFEGSLVLNGFPVTSAEFCLIGVSGAGQMSFVGFTVPLPE